MLDKFYRCVPLTVILIKRYKFGMWNAIFNLILQRQNKRRNTTFGVDFQEQVEKSRSAIPSIVTKCLTEIEKRGIMIKVSLQKNNTTHCLMIEYLFRIFFLKTHILWSNFKFFLGVFCFNNVNYLFWCLTYYLINVHMDELSPSGLS